MRLDFNFAFTKDTKDEARRQNERNLDHYQRERRAAGDPSDMGFTRAVADAVNEGIDEMPDSTTSFNVEVSGPQPLKISVAQGPR